MAKEVKIEVKLLDIGSKPVGFIPIVVLFLQLIPEFSDILPEELNIAIIVLMIVAVIIIAFVRPELLFLPDPLKYKVILDFPESSSVSPLSGNPSLIGPPKTPSDFRQAKCVYKVYSEGAEKKSNIATEIHCDFGKVGGVGKPFVYLEAPRGSKNPLFMLEVRYRGKIWYSYSYEPNKGSVRFETEE